MTSCKIIRLLVLRESEVLTKAGKLSITKQLTAMRDGGLAYPEHCWHKLGKWVAYAGPCRPPSSRPPRPATASPPYPPSPSAA